MTDDTLGLIQRWHPPPASTPTEPWWAAGALAPVEPWGPLFGVVVLDAVRGVSIDRIFLENSQET